MCRCDPLRYKELFSKHVRIIAMISEEDKQTAQDKIPTEGLLSLSEESLDLMKMQETSSFYKEIIGCSEEDVWNDLKPMPNISQEL